jgi:hypothetical protein
MASLGDAWLAVIATGRGKASLGLAGYGSALLGSALLGSAGSVEWTRRG